MSGLRIDVASTGELFVRITEEGQEDTLRAVLANDTEGRGKLYDIIEEFFDMETCSWCTQEVRDAELVEQPDGARICPDCAKEAEE